MLNWDKQFLRNKSPKFSNNSGIISLHDHVSISGFGNPFCIPTFPNRGDTWIVFIQGQLIEGGSRKAIPVINPPTEELISEEPRGTPQDVSSVAVTQKLIFCPHIPKCAGISLSHFFMDFFGPENVLLFYNNIFFVKKEKSGHESSDVVIGTPPFYFRFKKSAFRSQFGLALIRFLSRYTSSPPYEIKKIPKGARRVVHGHFRINPNLVQGVDLAIILREPLSRVISLFRYLQNENKLGRRTPRWFDPSQSIKKFILLPQNRDTYSRFLNGIPLRDFEYIGVTEKLGEFCRLFDPEGRIPVKHENQSPKYEIDLQVSTIEQFEERNISDYELYYQARMLMKERAGQMTYGVTSPS